MERMLATVLRSMDIDVEKIKHEIGMRVKAFEDNVETLNTTLCAHHKSLQELESATARIEAVLASIEQRIATALSSVEKRIEGE
jgi:hypothetical protein